MSIDGEIHHRGQILIAQTRSPIDSPSYCVSLLLSNLVWGHMREIGVAH